MTPIAMTDEPPTGQRPAIYRRQRTKNLLVAGLLLAFVVFVFVLSLVRMSAPT